MYKLYLLLFICFVGTFSEHVIAKGEADFAAVYDESTGKVIGSNVRDIGSVADFVGCTVWKQTMQSYVIGQEITFQGIIQDPNDHCRTMPVTGSFTCPVNGIYFVSISACKVANQPLLISVVKDRLLTQTFLILQHNSEDNANLYMSNSAIVRCAAGQEISVIAHGTGAVCGDVTITYTTFTIYLIDELPINGFSVHNNGKQNYSDGDTIEFPEAHYNEPGNFVANSYVCPVSGIYFLTGTTKKSSNEPLQTSITVYTRPSLSMIDTEVTNYDNTMTNSGLYRCYQGQVIQLRAVGAGSISGANYHSTFTGYLVHELDTTCYNPPQNLSFAGFTAFATIPQVNQIKNNLDFSSIVINEGGMFREVTNVFYCGVHGIYLVSLTLKSGGAEGLTADLKLETNTVVQLKDTANSGATLSVTVIVECEENWRIEVEASQNTNVYGDHYDRSTTLTAFLLARQEVP